MSPMEPHGSPPVTSAIVLAGGRSSRMGRHKALLVFDNEPLIVHIVTALRSLCEDVVVVGSRDQELPPLPATVIRDRVAYQGPVGGICYGLAAIRGEVAVVVACDSAFLSLPLLSHLLDRIQDHDVVVPHWDGRWQPLHAVYRKTVLPILEQQLARGESRPVQLFDKVRTCRIDEDEVRRFDPDGASFFNMNTPEDYAAALARWRDRRAGADASVKPAAIACTVELFGVARMVAKTAQVTLALPAGATLAHAFAALAELLPALKGRVIAADEPRLTDGYTCNINGRAFVRAPEATIEQGDTLVILSADAGG